MSQKLPRRSNRGFTLIELLVVVLILAILMALALPLYLSAVADSQRKTCRTNQQTIANTIQASRVKLLATDYSAFAGSVTTSKEPDLSAVPLCPNGGTYSVLTSGTTNDGKVVPSGAFAVQCSYGGGTHGSFIPGVDNN